MLFLLLSSLAALVTGALIYIFFRRQTIFTAYLGRFGVKAGAYSSADIPFGDFIRYYLPDYLWGYALCCQAAALFDVLRIKKDGAYILCAAVGIAWEVLQWSGVVSGTGDCVDCIMYLTAVGTVVLIEKSFKKGAG